MIDLRSSTRNKGGLNLVDENSAALAQCHSDLLLERILHFLASLLDIAHGLIDVPFSFKLVVARCPPGRLFDLAFGYLGHILGLVLLAHCHSVSRREISLAFVVAFTSNRLGRARIHSTCRQLFIDEPEKR
jgi:hypothetical protein